MYISKVKIQNFRLLKDSCLDMSINEKRNLSLFIGRNNSGKTSFIVAFDKFLNVGKFDFNDFPLELRENILNFNYDTNVLELSIKMIIEIKYTADDSLENLSEFILDLDTEADTVKILFECVIDKDKLIKELALVDDNKDKFIQKYLGDFLNVNMYVFDKDEDILIGNRKNLINKEKRVIDNLINFQVIHAKRDVSSSESDRQDKKTLSHLTTQYFNSNNKISYRELNDINKSIIKMDQKLDSKYLTYFDKYLESAKKFLNLDNLKVVSDLSSKEIVANYSKVVYGSSDSYLPEYLNGLGYMNILYLLLNIEIKKTHLEEHKKDINLLFIEEPEAHTHPQLQYVFIDKIKSTLSDVGNLQTFVSTHSPHIVKKSDFEDIRYFQKDENTNNVKIKNFYKDLKDKYKSDDPKKDKAEKAHFKFLNQYLTIASSELFFAEKIIFIEGTTEKILLPYMMDRFDKSIDKTSEITPLSSQNISILEVGANAKAFRHFIDFLGIKSLIITDIDTTKKTVVKKNGKETIKYIAHKVSRSDNTSNTTIKYYLDAPDFKIYLDDFKKWLKKLKDNKFQNINSSIRVAYQLKEKKYQGRSFEDAFISVNIDLIKENIKKIEGLQNRAELNNYSCFYELTERILANNGKSDFASSILWLALSDDIEWNIPSYIKNGLAWIAE